MATIFEWPDRSMPDHVGRILQRTRNGSGRVFLNRIDDSGPVQVHQIEGFPGELRDNTQFLGQFGLSTVPLPGARATVVYPAGKRNHLSVIVGIEDGRYRPSGGKGGEYHAYMVDGAKADGTGGTMRSVLRALLGWAVQLFGKTIAAGDSNTETVTVTSSQTVTIDCPTITLKGNVEITGTLKVDGLTTVGDIVITGTETGGGPA
jgi:phage baseplate assembly protein V